MEYKVAKIEKTNDGIEAEIHFVDENGDVAESRKFLYDASLDEAELEEAVRKDAEGVIVITNSAWKTQKGIGAKKRSTPKSRD